MRCLGESSDSPFVSNEYVQQGEERTQIFHYAVAWCKIKLIYYVLYDATPLTLYIFTHSHNQFEFYTAKVIGR